MGAHLPLQKFRISKLGFGLNPVSAQPVGKHQADKQRELYCARYNECLTFARDRDWPGFTCKYCACPDRLTPDELRRDTDGMAKMYRYRNKLLSREVAKRGEK